MKHEMVQNGGGADQEKCGMYGIWILREERKIKDDSQFSGLTTGGDSGATT